MRLRRLRRLRRPEDLGPLAEVPLGPASEGDRRVATGRSQAAGRGHDLGDVCRGFADLTDELLELERRPGRNENVARRKAFVRGLLVPFPVRQFRVYHAS